MIRIVTITIAALALAAAAAAQAASPALDRTLASPYPAARQAAANDTGSPEGAQARYDAARDLELSLPQLANPTCRPLLDALRTYARAQVEAAEAYDRLQPAARTRAIASANKAEATVDEVKGRCRGSDPKTPAALVPLEPAAGEAFAGLVSGIAPPHASRMRITTDGRRRGDLAVVANTRFSFRLGRDTSERIGLLELRFLDAGGRSVGVAQLHDLVRLPDNAFQRVPPARRDPLLDARLAAYAGAFDGYSGLWVIDLATGNSGSYNAGARFPAASTVKLGVVAATLRRYRGVARERIRYDLDQIGGWSSNLAANRLYRQLGRSAVEAALRTLGAPNSTYPGEYRAGTARSAAPRQPPLVSQRVTTAHDLASIFEALQRVASGDAAVSRRTGLSQSDARLALGILARSQPVADNAGLFAPFLPSGWLSASKHGWINSARHSVQLIYGPGGPVLAVALTYRDPLTLAQAQLLGRRVAELAVTLGTR